MIVLIEIDYPDRDPQGIKEALAMDCEKYGRWVRVVEVSEEPVKQETLWNIKSKI